MHCPSESIEKFEEISFLLKNKSSLKMSDFLLEEQNKPHATYNGQMREHTLSIN